jgi:hypothetical protein
MLGISYIEMKCVFFSLKNALKRHVFTTVCEFGVHIHQKKRTFPSNMDDDESLGCVD